MSSQPVTFVEAAKLVACMEDLLEPTIPPTLVSAVHDVPSRTETALGVSSRMMADRPPLPRSALDSAMETRTQRLEPWQDRLLAEMHPLHPSDPSTAAVLRLLEPPEA